MNRVVLMERLENLPGMIYDAERFFLHCSRLVEDAKQVLADHRARLLTGATEDGEPMVPGKNEKEREAHLFLLTEDTRRILREAEERQDKARLELERKRNEFAAYRNIARLLAAEAAERAA